MTAPKADPRTMDLSANKGPPGPAKGLVGPEIRVQGAVVRVQWVQWYGYSGCSAVSVQVGAVQCRYSGCSTVRVGRVGYQYSTGREGRVPVQYG